MTEDEVERLIRERDAWRKLARARGVLLTAFRVRGRTPEGALDDVLAARVELIDMGIEP